MSSSNSITEYARLHGLDVPRWTSFLAWAASGLALAYARRSHPAMLPSALAVSLSMFFAFGIMAYANDYWLVGALLVLCMASFPGAIPNGLRASSVDSPAFPTRGAPAARGTPVMPIDHPSRPVRGQTASLAPEAPMAAMERAGAFALGHFARDGAEEPARAGGLSRTK